MGGDEAQLADLRLQGGLADDRLDARGEADHLGHPGPLLGGGEVGPGAGADVARRADVERPAALVLEDVDARQRRQVLGEEPLAALRGRDARGVARQLLEGVDAEVADPFEQPVQHVDGGAGVVEGAVVGRRRRAEDDGQRGELVVADSSFMTSCRARWTVSSTLNPGHGCPVDRAASLRNDTSNPALCATSTLSRANSRNAGSTDSIRGACATIASVMPVSTWMNTGIGSPGSTRVWNSPSTSPPRTLTAPTSVIDDADALPPVVSRSTTTNVTSRSGVPRSSRVPWTARVPGPALPLPLTRPTVTARSDSLGQARGGSPGTRRCQWAVGGRS